LDSSALFLIIAGFFSLPYGAYTFLRIIVTGCSIYIAYKFFKRKERINSYTTCFSIIAIIFNPFVKISFSPDVWLVIDLLVALIFLFSYFKNR
jgi:hypothetical protein